MKIKNYALKTVALSAFVLSINAVAVEIEVGQPLEKVTINGELNLNEQQEIEKEQLWSTDQLVGKVHTVQHLAGRSSSKVINEAFIEAIKAAEFDRDKYQTTTIINLNDAVFGTGLIVKSKAQSSKKKYYWSSIVLDEAGEAQKKWDLARNSSAIMVLDKAGKVLFVKDGEMSKKEIKVAIQLIKEAL